MLATSLLFSLFAAQAAPANPVQAKFLEHCAAASPRLFSVAGVTGASTGALLTNTCTTQELESGQTLVTLSTKDKIEVLFMLEDIQALGVQNHGKAPFLLVQLK